MKNREEYQASIFAKRNALLQKRKKRISQAAAGTGIAIIFVAAFAFIPNLPDQTPQNSLYPTASESSKYEMHNQTTALFCEECLTFISDFDDGEYTKPSVTKDSYLQMIEGEAAIMSAGDSAITATEASEKTESEMPDCADEIEETTKRKGFTSVIDRLIHRETEHYTHDSGEDTIIQEAPADTGSDDETTKNTASNKFATEEVISAAIKHLSDEHKEFAADAKTSVITVTEPNCSYYLVFFDTKNGILQVKLNGQTLAHMETLKIPPKTIAQNAETITHRESYKGD